MKLQKNNAKAKEISCKINRKIKRCGKNSQISKDIMCF